MNRCALYIGVVAVMSVIFLGSGCATKSPHPTTVRSEVRQTLKTVSMAEDVQIPPSMRAWRGGGGALGVMMQISEDRFFNERVKEQIAIDDLVTKRIRDGWRARLEAQPLRKGMATAKAGEGDAEFVLVVDEFGLGAPSFTGKQNPTVRITGMLVSRPPYVLIRSKDRGNRLEPEDLLQNPILWMKTVEAPSKTQTSKYPVHAMGEYRNDAKLLAAGLEMAIDDALDMLIATLAEDAAGEELKR